MRIRWNGLQFAGALLIAALASACGQAPHPTPPTATAASSSNRSTDITLQDGMVRISEIDIEPAYLAEYNAILKEEAEASVRLEPGVIAIFSMARKDDPTVIRILEIYASRDAYQAHLKTPHFQKYKTTTLKMVRSLKLIDMDALDPPTMSAIFEKM